MAWDAPTHYGVACKRDDLRDPARRSAFNGRRTMPAALAGVIGVGPGRGGGPLLQQRVVAELRRSSTTCAPAAATWRCWPSTRPATWGPGSASTTRPGSKVGTVSHLRNTEYVLVAGDRARVRRMVAARGRRRLGRLVDRPGPGWPRWPPGTPCRFDRVAGPCQRGRAPAAGHSRRAGDDRAGTEGDRPHGSTRRTHRDHHRGRSRHRPGARPAVRLRGGQGGGQRPRRRRGRLG